MGTSHGCLDQEGVRLAGRPVNGSLVAHTKIDGNPELKDFVEVEAKGALLGKVYGMIIEFILNLNSYLIKKN